MFSKWEAEEFKSEILEKMYYRDVQKACVFKIQSFDPELKRFSPGWICYCRGHVAAKEILISSNEVGTTDG